MNRFYLPPAEFVKDNPALSAEESHHAISVLRLDEGQKITVFDGLGSEAAASIQAADRHATTLRIGQRNSTPPLPCSITLAQAIPKGKNMELILQKAVELGASRIVPLMSERTVVRLDADDSREKCRKWRAVVLEACKQCGQNRIPEVTEPQSIKDFLSTESAADMQLIASLQPDARHLKQWIAESGEHRKIQSATVMVGPEGDFTPAETALARSHQFQPLTLGPIILRTETAAIYCLSVLGHELFV
jgi:16S rRNA (uracil1498-N3)-methyltransferase